MPICAPPGMPDSATLAAAGGRPDCTRLAVRTGILAANDSHPEGKTMRIGVPKEIKVHEYRVGLVPAAVSAAAARPKAAS